MFFSEIAIKLSKSPYFFNIFRNFSFLNRTLGLRKSFLNQTTYVLKNRLQQQSFLNQDSFLNRAFLNRDSTVYTRCHQLYSFSQLFTIFNHFMPTYSFIFLYLASKISLKFREGFLYHHLSKWFVHCSVQKGHIFFFKIFNSQLTIMM